MNGMLILACKTIYVYKIYVYKEISLLYFVVLLVFLYFVFPYIDFGAIPEVYSKYQNVNIWVYSFLLCSHRKHSFARR